MSNEKFYSSMLYWQLKELEENLWSGTLVFSDASGAVTGRILFYEGFLSWAEAPGQRHNLFEAMNAWAGIGAEDILFAENIYKNSKSSKTFATVLEETGLLPVWTLRESLRVQIYYAVLKLASDDSADITKDESHTPAANQLFKTDELIYADNFSVYDQSISPIDLKGLNFFSIITASNKTVFRWPSRESEPLVLTGLAEEMRGQIAKGSDNEDYPRFFIKGYLHGYYMVKPLYDYFGTVILVGGDSTPDFFKSVAHINKYSSLIMVSLAEYIADFNTYGGE